MATRKVPAYNILTDYTQAQEDTLAASLSGVSDGGRLVYNTTLNKTRIWTGAAFATVPNLDPDGGAYSVNNAVGTYRNILTCSGSHIAGRVAGTYGLGYGNPIAISGTGTLYPLSTIFIASADFPTVNGLPPKLRIRAQLFTNDTAPGGNLTFGLHPITRPGTSGGAGLCIYTIGTVVSGSNGAVFTTPAADLLGTAVGADFALPADGPYIIGLVTTNTVATNAHVHLSAQLQLRNA